MGIGTLLKAVYTASRYARNTPGGSKIAQFGTQALALKEIGDALDSFFGDDGPGQGVPAQQSKKMKEAVTYLLTQVPEGFRGPWTRNGIEYDPKYLIVDMEKDRVFMTTKYYSRKSQSVTYNKGKEHGINKARKETMSTNQLAKGSR